ncbi:class I SAM-dependent methyltransferase [Thalassomonas haliotis]|uniref:Class I SAM-dependent methyltransferase n=1 Tax=Thalassomonas haliotis TaxID=485448 RepID=A0ABY7VQQ1_9GAMM|nr:class I SAM-dependent methyltransferase [Thalassomonas haliotis]WDE14517.1 class I SAM-dependent methyltransferase [Thalassomonas haliotis]
MDYLEINKEAWDKRTQVHVSSQFYDVEGFIAGKSSLNITERQLLGDVTGKSLLHLQCHFGLDTLSWARLGAKVTGVDLSSQAIAQAKALAQTVKLPARFINSDIYSFGETSSEQFDIVFTSYGVLCWLPDLDLWAKTIAKSLKPGGRFHLVEFHPFNDVLSGYCYFPGKAPDIEEEGTYTENCSGETSTTLTWPHSLSEVIAALINAGIVIQGFQEYAYSPYHCFPDLEYIQGQGYRLLFKGRAIPLLYSVTGQKSPEK